MQDPALVSPTRPLVAHGAVGSARSRWVLGDGGLVIPGGIRLATDVARPEPPPEVLPPAKGEPAGVILKGTARRRAWLKLQSWWMATQTGSSTPLVEAMVRFWHGHFTSELRKVRDPRFLMKQHQFISANAMGSFADLLHGITIDPAMLVYLDGSLNRKERANENFARELMELFTLGEGHYREADIKEAARAFTGWVVDRKTVTARFARNRHDPGEKSFLGRAGTFVASDAIDVVLEQPRTASFIVEKLWKEFVSPEPVPSRVAELASQFRAGGYAIAPLMEQLLSVPEFSDSGTAGSLEKSPMSLFVGLVRSLDLPVADASVLVRACSQAGQEPFNPPSVKGWPAAGWITGNRLLARDAWTRRLVHDEDRMRMPGRDIAAAVPDAILAQLETMTWEDLCDHFLTVPPVNPPPPSGSGIQQRLVAVITDPAFQVA